MSKRTIAFFFVLLLSQFVCAQDKIRIGYITHDQPISFDHNQKADGIMPDLIRKVLFKIDPNYEKNVSWIPFNDELVGEEQFKNNQLDFLLGEYSNVDINSHDIGVGISIYNDPIYLVAKKKHLSLGGLFNLIWNDLLKKALAYSLGLIILFTIIIYVLESKKHPQMKDGTRREAFSFTFFTITACFLRDLVYEPVTNAARFFYGAWMIISLFLITVITSVVTSTIILSTTDKTLRSLDLAQIKNQEIAYVYAHKSHKILIDNIDAKAHGYKSIKEIFSNIMAESIYYAAIPESVIHSYNHKNIDMLVVSESPIGYESYKILISPKLKTEYINQFNSLLVDVMLEENMYRLCSKYTDMPNHCNIV